MNSLKMEFISTIIKTNLDLQYEKQTYNDVEKFKREIIGEFLEPQSTVVPIGLIVSNNNESEFSDISIELSFTSSNKKKETTLKINRLSKFEFKKFWLCDLNQLDTCVINISRVSYLDNGKRVGISEETGGISLIANIPYIVIPKNLGVIPFGYEDVDSFCVGYLLQLFKDTINARNYLLDKSFELLDEEIKGLQNNLIDIIARRTRSRFLELDIISKLMFLIEDFVILSSAIQRGNGNYFNELSRIEQFKNESKDNDKYDLGTFIGCFFKDLENISEKEYEKLFSYPSELDNEDKNNINDLTRKLVDRNINIYKNLLNKIKEFSNSHHKVFKRYKHACLTMSFQKIQLEPKDDPIYVFNNYNDLSEVIELPYSESLIKEYKNIRSVISTLLKIIIKNKHECLHRRLDAIIPLEEFDQVGLSTDQSCLSEDQKKLYFQKIKKYNQKYPYYAHNVLVQNHFNKINDEIKEWNVKFKS